METIIANSFLSLDNLYRHSQFLNNLAVNRYQLFTIFWNVFLVFLALMIFVALKKYWRGSKLIAMQQKIIGFVLFIFWLLFFPNTAYIITDVRHLLDYCPADSLNRVCVANAWMIMFFFFYACFGWISFYYLLKKMVELVKEIFGLIYSRLFMILIIPITALGVLLGLLNRFNSWDVFSAPGLILKASWAYFSELNYFIDWLIFAVFLYLLYFVGDAIFRGEKK